MTIFFICAALLVVLCLLWLLLGLFRNRDDAADQEAVNITLARERGDILKQALEDGSIDQATYDYERQQLDYDLAADLVPDNKQRSIKGSGHITAAAIVAIFIPIASGALYLKLGNPAAINQQAGESRQLANSGNASAGANAGAQLPAPLAELLPKLEERLEANPEDIQGWRLLGRSYLSLQNYPKAREALEKARALDDTDVDTITQLAESIAMSKGGDLSGEAMELLEQSISINPLHEHTLWLRSIGKQQAGDHQEALVGFNYLMGLAQDNPDAVATIDQMRSRSIQALGANSVRQANQSSTESNSPTEASDTPVNDASISVTVSLSDEAKAAAEQNQAVFIYATATNGPPMPLAVSRLTVAELPATVVLDDSMAMIPAMKLSSFDEITIGARISASGNAIAQSGDWFSETNNIKIADTKTVSLSIDQITP